MPRPIRPEDGGESLELAVVSGTPAAAGTGRMKIYFNTSGTLTTKDDQGQTSTGGSGEIHVPLAVEQTVITID